MDKSLDEIIGSSKPAAQPTSAGISKRTRSRRGGRGGPAGRAVQTKGQKAVLIRNLSDTISESDIRDLFRQVGPVVKVVVDRNDAGDRSGVAWVLYDFADDAVVAAERFNQRKAAGQTITVRRVGRVGDTGSLGSSATSLSSRIGGSQAASSRFSRRRDRGGDKQNNRPPKTRSTADLDAELDAYMQVDSAVTVEPSTSNLPEAKEEASMIDV